MRSIAPVLLVTLAALGAPVVSADVPLLGGSNLHDSSSRAADFSIDDAAAQHLGRGDDAEDDGAKHARTGEFGGARDALCHGNRLRCQ